MKGRFVVATFFFAKRHLDLIVFGWESEPQQELGRHTSGQLLVKPPKCLFVERMQNLSSHLVVEVQSTVKVPAASQSLVCRWGGS